MKKPTFIFIISWENRMSIWIHKKLTIKKRFLSEAFCHSTTQRLGTNRSLKRFIAYVSDILAR